MGESYTDALSKKTSDKFKLELEESETGHITITGKELYQYYFNCYDLTIGRDSVAEVERRLPDIRKQLSEKYNLRVCLLNKTYFTKYRGREITDDIAARCIAGGTGKGAVGIWCSRPGVDDPMYRAFQKTNVPRVNGQVGRHILRAVDSVIGGIETEERAGEMLLSVEEAMQLTGDKQVLKERLVRQARARRLLIGTDDPNGPPDPRSLN